MSVRNFLTLVSIFAVVGVAAWIAQLNSQAVILDPPGLPAVAAPLWMALGLAFVAGLFVALLYSLAISSREAWQRRREARSREQDARVDESFERGVAAALRGDAETARELLGAVAQQRPDRAQSWMLAGDAARAADDPRAAREMHLRARGLAPSEPAVLDALSRDAEALGDVAEAIDRLRERHDVGEADPDSLVRLRDLLGTAGRWREAIDVQRRILAGTDDPRIRALEERRLAGLRLARARERLGQGEDGARRAHEELEELTREDPGFVPGWIALAECRGLLEDPEGKIDALRRGFERTGALELLRLRVDAHLEADRPEEAIRTWERAAASLEGDRRLAARLMLGRLYHRLGLVDEAREAFDRLADETRFSPVVDYYRAKLRARSGHHQAAYELLQSSILRAGLLDDRYACEECGAAHDAWSDRCRECRRWGTVRLDITRDLRPVEQVVAPRV